MLHKKEEEKKPSHPATSVSWSEITTLGPTAELYAQDLFTPSRGLGWEVIPPTSLCTIFLIFQYIFFFVDTAILSSVFKANMAAPPKRVEEGKEECDDEIQSTSVPELRNFLSARNVPSSTIPLKADLVQAALKAKSLELPVQKSATDEALEVVSTR